MNDNNENNIDETTAGVNEAEQTVEEDALAGITEEDVTDTDVNEESVAEDTETEEEAEETEETVEFPSHTAEESFVDRIKNMNKKQIGCLAVLGVVIIAVIVVIIVLATSGKKKVEVNTTPVTVTTKATQGTTSEATSKGPVEAVLDVSFDTLHETNEDIYAYIYIPGTEISYPILQSDEARGKAYYLSYTPEHYYTWYGSIYTHYNVNKKDFSDKNTIIYGHSASRNIDSVMFTKLHYYEDPDFFAANKNIYIYVDDKQLTYEIFAAVNYSDNLIAAYYDVTSGADTVKFVNEAKTLYGGVVDDSVVIDENSQIITLSTCTMYPNYDESKRFLVLAKLVDESTVKQ